MFKGGQEKTHAQVDRGSAWHRAPGSICGKGQQGSHGGRGGGGRARPASGLVSRGPESVALPCPPVREAGRQSSQYQEGEQVARLELVKSSSPREVPSQRRPGTRLSQCPGSTQPRGQREHPKSHSPRVPRDTIPTAENGTFRPQGGLLLGRKAPLFPARPRGSCGALRREPR